MSLLSEKQFANLTESLLRGSGKRVIKEITNCSNGLAELCVARICAVDSRHLIWVVRENEKFSLLALRLRQWLGFLNQKDREVYVFSRPFEDPYINNSISPRAVARKMKLAAGIQNSQPMVVITTLSALGLGLEKKETLKEMVTAVHTGDSLARDSLIDRMISLGYTARDMVEEPGDVAWRGSIVDLFAPGEELPVRIEFEGSMIVSLRRFDVDSQKSVAMLEHTVFFPGCYYADQRNTVQVSPPEKSAFLPDILSNPRMVVSDWEAVNLENQKLMAHFRRIREATDQDKESLPLPEKLFGFSLKPGDFINLSSFSDETAMPSEIRLLRRSLIDFNREDIDTLLERVKSGSLKLVICSALPDVQKRLGFLEEQYTFLPYNIPCSFENTAGNTLYLQYRPWQPPAKKIQPRSDQLSREQLLSEIRTGDLVTHQKHGIGRFAGLMELSVSGFDRITGKSVSHEFLKIEYQNREYLYVPVYEIGDLSKYVAFEGYAPQLDRLGGKTWQIKQNRARKSIVSFARELLELYALRKAVRGRGYFGDSELEEILQKRFRYVETGDQKKAIHDVLHDLEEPFPMDRLVCGDVSFGKTEVAVRAAFRVILNHRQVALLCPTTILASQHLKTFRERFHDLPVKTALLSRMVSAGEKRRVKAELALGKIDLVVGTHALLSKKMEFKNLGLLVIDEEQRFGVFQKERLKQKYAGVDVLTLSATPIPRTLSFSMAGLQDISVIRTPPLGRLSIRNHVGYFSRETLISAVLNELERKGQVYIVYNDIQKIYSFREQLAGWLPEVEMAVIHAKMKSSEIDVALLGFVQKKYRVLLSTTIIENGIDIPAVNTLIVMQAERFGLTQLYQLRGRIGRGDRQAFAYFLVSSPAISDKARSRLQAIREFADLGSGFRLAEFDLKLRGAGSLLGNRQHGHIEALGFDYYLDLLHRTVRELKGDGAVRKPAELKVNFTYAVDSAYIPDTEERVAFYRKVLDAETPTELRDVCAEMEDRYGKLHASMERVFCVAAARLLGSMLKLEKVELFPKKAVLRYSLPVQELTDLQKARSGRLIEPRAVEISYTTYTDLLP